MRDVQPDVGQAAGYAGGSPGSEAEGIQQYAPGGANEFGGLKMANDAKFTPGMPVWVIERDIDGNGCELSGYIFLAKVGNAVILTPRIYGLDDLEELLDYLIEETWNGSELPLPVFPVSDCYIDRVAAKEALLAEEG